MNENLSSKTPRSRRSNVLLTASIDVSGTSVPVKLRNLSPEGALIEGEKLPIEGSEVVFHKAELSVGGRIAWVEGKRAGLTFAELLRPDQILRHIAAPRPRVQGDFRRPGLASKPLSSEELSFGVGWLPRSATPVE